MGRLGADAARIVAAAGQLARRYRHAQLEPEHILSVLASESRMEPVLASLAVDRAPLASALEGRLAEWPALGLYRDARTEPVASGGVHILLERASGRGLIALLRPTTLEQLGRAACALPTLVPLLMEARANIITATDAVAHARLLAIARGDAWLSAFHVVHVFADGAWLATALRGAGLDPRAFQGAFEERMRTATARDALLVKKLEKRGLNRTQMLTGLLRARPVAALFSGLGVPLVRVLRGLIDGVPLDDESLPDDDGANIDIVFNNDDMTSMAFVVDTLGYCFDVPPLRAAQMTLEVHKSGAASVAVLPAPEARERIEKCRAHARREGMPLRITWRQHEPTSAERS